MIPSDNYFVLNPPSAGTAFTDTPLHGDALEEYVALGVRNPWRMAVDPVDGAMAMFNVGSNDGTKYEEVEIYEPGANFGWPYREGSDSKTFETGRSRPPAQYGPVYLGNETDAAAFWEHSAGGQVAVGGLFYRGAQWPQVDGQLIMADHNSGKIWALDYKDSGAPSATRAITDGVSVPNNYSVRLLIDSNLAIRQMAAGPDLDEIYIAANGSIHRLYNSSHINPEAPALLSETGVFTDLSALTPRAGLIPYAPASQLWSDRAHKLRWIAVPNDRGTPGEYDSSSEQITYSADGEWEYPIGTVFVKHFSLPTDLRDQDNPDFLKPIETRFLVRGEDGVYFYFTYQWREDGTEADLLTSEASADYDILDEVGEPLVQTWTYPSRENCADCHQVGAGSVLGMKSRQLNHFIEYLPGNKANQITTFSELGLFNDFLDFATLPGGAKCVDIDDETQSLELRVRSYMDSNCSFCHRPESEVGRAQFDALLTTPLNLAGLVGEIPLAGELGISGAEILKPGAPDQSVLYVRDSLTDSENMMPPIGRDINDPSYIPLLRAWIERMGYPEFDSWAQSAGISGSLMDDSDGDEVLNIVEFFLGLSASDYDLGSLPQVMNPGGSDPEIRIPISGAALTDGFTLLVEGSSDLENWFEAGTPESGLTVVSDTSSPGTTGERHIRFTGDTRTFLRYTVVVP